jgi:hypothetical protein
MSPQPASAHDSPASDSRLRVRLGASVLTAVAGMLILALNGRNTLFPPKLPPPSTGDGTIAEETAAATRFLTNGSGPARRFGTHEIVLSGNGSVSQSLRHRGDGDVHASVGAGQRPDRGRLLRWRQHLARARLRHGDGIVVVALEQSDGSHAR